MSEPSLSADCAQCAALCCAYYPFDKSDQFAADKPAGEPCVHLSGTGRCKIHGSLKERGYPGCAAYDCLGAGQHVVQGLFGGRSWQQEPALKAPMFEAFRAMRLVHDLLSMLNTAEILPLEPSQRHELSELKRDLVPEGGWTVESLGDFETGPAPGRIRAFLRTLGGAASGYLAARQTG